MKTLGKILGLTALVATGATQAHEYTTHGVAGASAGYAHRSGAFGIQETYDQQKPEDQYISRAFDISDDSFLYGVFAGVESRCKNWIVGFEFNIDWQTSADEANNLWIIEPRGSNSSSSSSNGPVREYIQTRAVYDRDTVMGLTMRVGYQWCWFTPYARIGVETSRDYLNVALSEGLYNTHTQQIILEESRTPLIGHGSERSYRLVVGAGAEFCMDQYLPNTTLRVEYNYHGKGNDVDVRTFAHIPNPPLTGVPYHAHSNPHAHTIRASLAYNFL